MHFASIHTTQVVGNRGDENPSSKKGTCMLGFAAISLRSTMRAALACAVLIGAGVVACSDPDPLAEARALQAQGQLEESLEPLRRLLEAKDDSAEVHYRYGLALARTGKPGVAVWSLRRAQEDPDWERRASLELTRAALLSLNWANAIEAATRVLEAEPDNLEAIEYRAEAYLGQMTHPELALADLERAIELDPDAVRLKASRTRALIMTDQLEEASEAIADLENVYREASGVEKRALGPVCALRVVFAVERGETEKSEREMERCLEEHPADGTVIDTAIDLYDGQGSYERSTEIVRTALDEVPTSLRYRSMLANRLRGMGRVEEAEGILRAGFEFDSPGSAESTWVALAQHFAAINEVGAAADAYGEAIKLSPQVSQLGWLTYADMLAGAGRNEEALEAASHVKADHYRKLVQGRVSFNEGDPRRALELFDQMLPLWPNNAAARYFAARSAEQLGDFDRAIEEYRQSVRSDAAATDAGLRLARLFWAMGDPQSAWVACHHHLQAQPGDRDGHLFMVQMALRRGRAALRNQLKIVSGTAHWPSAIEVYLDGIAEQSGDAEAVERFSVLSLDLTQPWNADALRSAVRHWIGAGEKDTARAAVAAALAAHPDEAAFHAIAGLELELNSGSPAAGRTEYERAIEIDPSEGHALEALGRIAEAGGDIPRALDYFDRAALASSGEPEIPLQAARLLAAQADAAAEAELRWRAVSREFPWATEPLMSLSRIELDRANSEEALTLAERAIVLGGGDAAWSLLAEIYDLRGEEELAEKARERANPPRS